MKTFHVIDQLILRNGVLVCKKPSRKSYQKAHYKQGDLDGACGAYSIAMALNILGVFEADNIYVDEEFADNRCAEWKLVRALNKRGLYRNGLTSEDIDEIITENFSKYVRIESTKNKECFNDLVLENIENNTPLILEISFNKKDRHWIVVVGYTLDEKGKITSYLTLDPGSDSPTFRLWNGIINLNKVPHKIYGYHYNSNNKYMVSLDEMVIISKK